MVLIDEKMRGSISLHDAARASFEAVSGAARLGMAVEAVSMPLDGVDDRGRLWKHRWRVIAPFEKPMLLVGFGEISLLPGNAFEGPRKRKPPGRSA